MEITKAQLLCWRLGTLKNEHRATPAQISLAKRNNVKWRSIFARESRQILGGMGIMGEFPMMRHAANLESVITMRELTMYTYSLPEMILPE